MFKKKRRRSNTPRRRLVLALDNEAAQEQDERLLAKPKQSNHNDEKVDASFKVEKSRIEKEKVENDMKELRVQKGALNLSKLSLHDYHQERRNDGVFSEKGKGSGPTVESSEKVHDSALKDPTHFRWKADDISDQNDLAQVAKYSSSDDEGYRTYSKDQIQEMQEQHRAPLSKQPPVKASSHVSDVKVSETSGQTGLEGTGEEKDDDGKPEMNKDGKLDRSDTYMEIDDKSDNSSEDSEWEREQLKRANVLTGFQREFSNTALADDVAYGVEGRRTDRLAESIFDAIEGRDEAEEKSHEAIFDVKVENVLDEIEGAIQKQENTYNGIVKEAQNLKDKEEQLKTMEENRKQRSAEAATRVSFYEEFKDYTDALGDMMAMKSAEMQERRIKDRNVEKLRKSADKRFSVRDAHGRPRRLQISGDGFHTDEEERCSINSEDEYSDEESSERSTEEATDDDDILADVEEKYLNLELTYSRFKNWKERYSKDYDSAYGDLSLSLVLGGLMEIFCDIKRDSPIDFYVDFLAGLPPGVRGGALLASKLGERVALHVRVHWYPSSTASTEQFVALVKHLWACLGDVQPRYKEKAAKVQESILAACGDVLQGEIDVLQSARAAPAEKVIRRAVKLIRSSLSLQDALENDPEFGENIKEIVRKIVAPRADNLSDERRAELLHFAIREGLKLSRDYDDETEGGVGSTLLRDLRQQIEAISTR